MTRKAFEKIREGLEEALDTILTGRLEGVLVEIRSPNALQTQAREIDPGWMPALQAP